MKQKVLFLMALLCLVVGRANAGSSYTAKLTAKVNIPGAGKVYVSTGESDLSKYGETSDASVEKVDNGKSQTFNVFALETNGAYKFVEWTEFMGDKTAKNITVTLNKDNNDQTITAKFEELPKKYTNTYAYTVVDGEYQYLSRGGDWGTQAVASDFSNAINVNVINADEGNARIQFVDTEDCLFDAGDNLLFTDNRTNNITAYNFILEQSGNGFKIKLATDTDKSLGIVDQEGYKGWEEGSSWPASTEKIKVVKLVQTSDAPVWYFTKSEAKLAVSAQAHYGTFVAPFDIAIPNGITAHQITSKDETSVTLGSAITETLTANTPVILHNTTDKAITATLKGWPTGTQNENSDDYLIGVYEAGAVSNGYALQYQNEETKFFLINGSAQSAANRAYLSAEAFKGEAKINLYFEGEETAISSVEPSESTVSAIYSVSGTKVSQMQKGMNIVKYSDGTIKKVFVK